MRSAVFALAALLALILVVCASEVKPATVDDIFKTLKDAKNAKNVIDLAKGELPRPSSEHASTRGIGPQSKAGDVGDSSFKDRLQRIAHAKNLVDVEDQLPTLNFNTAMKKISLAKSESTLIALFLVGVGVVLCFAGKVFFKVFLGLVGFVFGGLLGLRGLGIAAQLDILPQEHAKLTAYIVVLVAGIIGATLCLCLWRWGVYLAAATAGYFATTVFIALPFMLPVVDAVNRNTLLAAGVVVAVVAAWLFNNVIVIVASSIIGAFMTVVGADMIMGMGFIEDMYNMAVERDPEIPTEDDPAYALYAAFAGLVVAGVVAQLLFMRSQRSS